MQLLAVRWRAVLSVSGQSLFLHWFYRDLFNFKAMIQHLIIALLFLSAVVYLGVLVYRSFQAKSCATGCGKCGAIDVEKLAKEIRSREKLTS